MSVRKTPITLLKDLILRYDAWTKGGGVRASMAAPLPWEEEEERERRYVLPAMVVIFLYRSLTVP